MMFKPHKEYDMLLIQARGLYQLNKSLERDSIRLRNLYSNLINDINNYSKEEADALRNENERLTNIVEPISSKEDVYIGD